MKFRKKPVVIDAIQVPLNRRELGPVAEFMYDGCNNWSTADDGGVDIGTLEGVMHANPGDWIIKGVKGEYYPCKPDIFAATYDPAE